VLGVEPDGRMAVIARRHGLSVEQARFEEWDPAGRRFDLVISGQASHWVDPEIGPAKAADVLEPAGTLGVFWNVPGFDPTIGAQLDAVYQLVAPQLARNPASGTGGEDRARRFTGPMEETGRFVSVEVRSYQWEATYSTERYLDQLRTHSDHMVLDPDQQREILDGVGDVITAAGGHLTVNYTTVLIHAKV